jgi:hypothetical protein
MNEIHVLAGSSGLLVLYAPLTLVHRGRAYVLVETTGNKIRLETAVSGWNENGLTHLTARLDTTAP